MDAIIHGAPALQGRLTVPPDKAIAHRAVLIAAIAEGSTRIAPRPSADDCRQTVELVRQLGVRVDASPDSVVVEGCGGERFRPLSPSIDCGESGTTFRLAAGLLAGHPGSVRLTAGPSLSRRPMKRIITPLTRMGARLKGTRSGAGSEEWYPPITVQGRCPLRAIRYPLDVASAQVKSAILLAGLSADGPTTVMEPVPTRDHTERMLRHYGAAVQRDAQAITLAPGPLRSPGRLELPGDFSGAVFFLVAGACVPGSRLALDEVGVNPTRTTSLEVLRRMGAQITVSVSDDRWEPRGTVAVEACPLRGVVVEAREVPGLIDELPALMVAAACARGVSIFRGIGELRVKETDRIRSMMAGLQRFGVRVRLPDPESVEIEGGRLIAAQVDSAGDHRTAMSLAVAGLAAQGVSVIRGAGCVAKSFPDFFERLGVIAGAATVKTVDKAGGLC